MFTQEPYVSTNRPTFIRSSIDDPIVDPLIGGTIVLLLILGNNSRFATVNLTNGYPLQVPFVNA